MRKSFMLVALAALLVLAGAVSAQDQVTLEVWTGSSSDVENQLKETQVAAVEEANPNIDVNLLADRLWPLALPGDDGARIVLAHDGTPLWRFADRNGVCRHPVGVDEVSPLYLEALLTYEDRWFRHHYGVNPLALARAAWQNLGSGRIVSGSSTLSMQVARLLYRRIRALLPASCSRSGVACSSNGRCRRTKSLRMRGHMDTQLSSSPLPLPPS